jgi:hypothetical protein
MESEILDPELKGMNWKQYGHVSAALHSKLATVASHLQESLPAIQKLRLISNTLPLHLIL